MDNNSISIIRGNFAKGSSNQFISSERRGCCQVNIKVMLFTQKLTECDIYGNKRFKKIVYLYNCLYCDKYIKRASNCQEKILGKFRVCISIRIKVWFVTLIIFNPVNPNLDKLMMVIIKRIYKQNNNKSLFTVYLLVMN